MVTYSFFFCMLVVVPVTASADTNLRSNSQSTLEIKAPTAYYARNLGQTCESAANIITSTEDCKEALRALGKSDTIVYTGRVSSIPGGCSMRTTASSNYKGQDDGHFETSGKVGKGRGDLAPVCKSKIASADGAGEKEVHPSATKETEKEVFKVPFGTTYYAKNLGQTCEIAANVITSEEECKSALRTLGKSDTIVYTGHVSSVPGGCSLRTTASSNYKGQDDGHFETSSLARLHVVGSGRVVT